MSAPVVSIVIPTFNCARYLPEAIASVIAQHPSQELIVVDDGSTDDTAAVVAGLDADITFIQQANGGISAARNAGIARARGTYLALLDADDLAVADRVVRQLAHIEQAGGPDLSFGAVEEFVSPDLPPEQQARYQPRGRMAGRVAGALLVRRSAFDRVGPFATAWRVGEFADWFMRATDAGLRAGDLPEVVVRRRLHGDNIGLRQRDARVDFARIMKHALDRRRQSTPTEPT